MVVELDSRIVHARQKLLRGEAAVVHWTMPQHCVADQKAADRSAETRPVEASEGPVAVVQLSVVEGLALAAGLDCKKAVAIDRRKSAAAVAETHKRAAGAAQHMDLERLVAVLERMTAVIQGLEHIDWKTQRSKLMAVVDMEKHLGVMMEAP